MAIYPLLKYLLILPALFVAPDWATAQSLQSQKYDGTERYHRQEYDKALESFKGVREQEPQNAEVIYNLANSQYKSGKFAEAARSFDEAYVASADPDLQQKALYNKGNAQYRLGQFDESIKTYKKALDLKPNDMDAKFNLEYVQEQLKKKQEDSRQNQKSDNQRKPKDSSKGEQKENSSSPEQKPEDEAKKNSGNKDDENKKQNKDSENKEQQTEPQGSEDKGSAGDQTEPKQAGKDQPLTRQEAENWLKALRENPKLLSKAQSAEQGRNPPYMGKDW